ncbi:MAG: cytochrome c3 family protein [bacterium]
MGRITKKISSSTAAWVALLLLILFVSGLTIGCSRGARHRVLSFFFDDVPPLDQTEDSSAADSLKLAALSERIHPDSAAVVQPTWSFHPTSEKRECTSCHDREQSFRLFDEPKNLCVSCHDQADAIVVHAPVEAGACVDCHNPHGSKNPRMLVEIDEALCFQCHNKEEVKPAEAVSLHTPVEAGNCLDCHNPHGTKNPSMLVEAPETLCFECHDVEHIKPSSNMYIHAPVEADACLDCHDPHGTQNPRMLVEAGQDLCFQCHDQEDIKSSESHEGIEDMVCYECHDPHNADNEYFIR